MSDEVLEEKELSIEDYLALFQEGSADFELVKKNSSKLSRIVVKTLRDPSGRLAEDTTFYEKSGIQYTIRSWL